MARRAISAVVAVAGAWALTAALAVAPALAASRPPAAPPTNPTLLLRAVRSVADQLVAQAPIAPGTRVGLRSEVEGPLEADVREAFLAALTARRLECVLLAPAAAAAETAQTEAAAPVVKPPDMTKLDWQKLQEMRQANKARVDSLAALGTGTADGAGAHAGFAGPAVVAMPVLTFRVNEARVDYVRSYHTGLWGTARVERRAIARLTLRLSPPRSDAVTWLASRDTTAGDVVLRSELDLLEDTHRPETRGVLRPAGIKKALEPALVVVLIVGLVSLFYQNRP